MSNEQPLTRPCRDANTLPLAERIAMTAEISGLITREQIRALQQAAVALRDYDNNHDGPGGPRSIDYSPERNALFQAYLNVREPVNMAIEAVMNRHGLDFQPPEGGASILETMNRFDGNANIAQQLLAHLETLETPSARQQQNMPF
jgi:hypothetical protein